MPVESHQDEIGSLSRSFQHMVDEVKVGAKALKESEARVTAVLNHTVDGIIVIDERGIVETFNPAAEKTFGYAASEVIGQNISMLTAEPDRSQHDEYIKRYLRTREAKIIGVGREVTGLRKDGSTFPLDLAISEVFIGKRRLFTGVTRDITKRKKMEKQLEVHTVSLEKMVEERTHALIESLDVAERAKNRIDGILRSIADGLIVTDAEHNIMLMNRPAEQILGVSAQTAIGQSTARIISDETMGEQVKVALDKKASSDPFDFELRGRDIKHPRIIRARTAVILDKDGGVVGAVTIMHDVTHEHGVNRMKTEFVSTVAHELRTPLTSIKGFAELLQLKKNIPPEKKSRYLFREPMP